MRTAADRIRHAIAFELIGLILIIGIMTQFGFDAAHTGVLGIAFSLLATGWNYIYNVWFDKAMQKWAGTTEKKQKHRILHALLFELGLLWVTIPVIAWWLNLSLWNAFLMDIGLVLFYLVYAYVYNLAYDKLFPVKTPQAHA
ncbi:PACE efflux transporter [Enterovibrio norvegicus]|uniref:Transporter n=1 Tax=Enterovibrio norvegicus TaxID=188144 RepID=A0A2N7LAX3_9GAMM|nr:PACE efflux transporter [Enterovibrio norvegicus]PML79387.1 transporter [Enterovibrio norvegicus]PMN69470.1 transporter [Enterovibrio norvegicus]PMN92123.1 transporter [Enterovibrio norvegicus]